MVSIIFELCVVLYFVEAPHADGHIALVSWAGWLGWLARLGMQVLAPQSGGRWLGWLPGIGPGQHHQDTFILKHERVEKL